MSSKSPNRRASTSVSEREREKRVAAKARRQAARATHPAPEPDSQADTIRQDDGAATQSTARASRPVAKREGQSAVPAATVRADAEAPAIPMGDPHGDVATWLALVLMAMVAVLIVMIVAAS